MSNQKLKDAMQEIKDVLTKYDIAGHIALADGQNNGEYLAAIDSPSWSLLRFIPRPNGSSAVHVKVHMKSKKEETEKTINALVNLQNTTGMLFLNVDKVIEHLREHVQITEEPIKE